MSGLSRGANIGIARQVPWSRYKTFADIGTAQGDLAVQIALANSHLEGIGFDLAEVAPIFEEYVESHGLSGRVRFQPGDFFTQDLPRVDVLTMGHILHDWNLEQKKTLVAKAFAALNPGGALVV
jgi:2-polyprenyl-3-methyl-5-hydroxy-6-metoxy-1,4-benzoquinol methylase